MDETMSCPDCKESKLLAQDAMNTLKEIKQRYGLGPRNLMKEKDREIQRLSDQVRELQATFDLRWKADMRAIKRWQEAHPGNELTWPDHADLVVWLMEQIEPEPNNSDATPD